MLRTNASRDYPALYRGVVEDNIDEKNLGRCKVRVPSIHGELLYPPDILPWARPLVLSPVGKEKGSVNIPDVGDIVWVFFEGGNKDFPVYLGGTYAIGDVSIDQNIVDFYIEKEFKISYDRISDTYSIKVGDIKILVNNELIQLIGDTRIEGSLEITKSLKISGDLTVAGTTTLNNLIVNGSCNRECDCK